MFYPLKVVKEIIVIESDDSKISKMYLSLQQNQNLRSLRQKLTASGH